jgi:adenylate cyclase
VIHPALCSGNAVRPTFGECREQIERIRLSPDFNATEREHHFLAYIVSETLSGRADRIKAYSVAIEVFGRASSFDPQNDPIVRITANHLRRSLERYYLLSGRADQIIVSIPKGCYVPTFAFRCAGPAKLGDVTNRATLEGLPLMGDQGVPPGTEDVRLQLERIIQSDEFPSTGRSAAFLRYVVEEVLAAREARIKGYSIAIEVFKRPASFTQDDPVVRIEAGRLRKALERYYLVAGQSDPIKIDIPKGGYVPTFAWNRLTRHEPGTAFPTSVTLPIQAVDRSRIPQRLTTAVLVAVGLLALTWWYTPVATFSSNAGPERPSLIVAPFENLGEGSTANVYAGGITQELLTALVRFKDVKIVGRATNRSTSAAVDQLEINKRGGADYLLTGAVRSSMQRLRVTAQLTSTSNGEVVWSQTYDNDLRDADLISLQSEVASRVATTLAQPNGIISRDGARTKSSNELKTYECTAQFYTYRSELTATMHAQVRTCLEEAVARYPDYATAWAMLSIAYLDEARFRFNPRHDLDPLKRALQAARRATELDAGNVRGLQALMMSLVFNRQYGEAMRVGEQAIAANPNDAELLGELGTRVALAGDWHRGALLLDRAIALNPSRGAYHYGTRALAAYFLNEPIAALDAIRQADLERFPLFHAVAAIIYVDAGLPEKARDEAQVFMKKYPTFVSNITAELQMRFYRPQDQMRVAEGLRKAGIPIKPAYQSAVHADARH